MRSETTTSIDCCVAQRKRVGLITQRSVDRNHPQQYVFANFDGGLPFVQEQQQKKCIGERRNKKNLFIYIFFLLPVEWNQSRSKLCSFCAANLPAGFLK